MLQKEFLLKRGHLNLPVDMRLLIAEFKISNNQKKLVRVFSPAFLFQFILCLNIIAMYFQLWKYLNHTNVFLKNRLQTPESCLKMLAKSS